jgi:excisionase family DNA binding protein
VEQYVERTSSMINISEAARLAGVSSERFRRAVRRLKIPIARSGWTVLIDRSAITRVKAAWASGRIAPGRPKKKARG